jgi:RNA polymerase sigma factor (sigma-70 family)
VLEHYYRELLHYFSRMTGGKDTAADIVQETYARVLSAQKAGTVITEPRALLYRTGKNVLIDQHRRDAVRGNTAVSEEDDNDEPGALDTLVADSATEPDTALASSKNVNRMLAVIDALPTRCREAFVLHKFDGLSHAEVAARMGISKKMVEQHIKLAMQACRRCKDQMDGVTPMEDTPMKRRKP